VARNVQQLITGVRTLTAIMTSPMGYEAGPAWARALAGQSPEPGDLPAPSPEFLRHVAAMASSPPATPATLVIHGTGDPLLPLPNGQALAALIPGARFEAVPGMGHGFFSPGIPARIAGLILDHTAARP
jgi:pimeloyl-ACP methyl ester carboxylesterase